MSRTKTISLALTLLVLFGSGTSTAYAVQGDDAALMQAAQLYAQGKYAEAEPLYGRALRIGEASLGPDHPIVATVAENLAAVLRQLGREDEARKLEERAAAIRKKGKPQLSAFAVS